MKHTNDTQKYFIQVIYQGNKHFGWQKQPNTTTIQGELEQAFQQISYPTSITGSGRTDTGVHALGQVAHLDLPAHLDPHHIIYQVNAVLPKSIYIQHIRPVIPEAHARFDALARSYTYYITQHPNPFTYQQSYHYPHPIDLKTLQALAYPLQGPIDATSLCKTTSRHENNTCVIHHTHWGQEGQQIIFRITANRFLHHMVRTIVGTLLHCMKTNAPKNALEKILHDRDRRSAGPTAPSTGLFLTHVDYPPHIYLESQATNT